jgi:hypothetical protein
MRPFLCLLGLWFLLIPRIALAGVNPVVDALAAGTVVPRAAHRISRGCRTSDCGDD